MLVRTEFWCMSAFSYIIDNSLPCVTYLDFSDPSSITVSGNTYTALNKIGNTTYDFIATTLQEHPVATPNGANFSAFSRLRPRNSNILQGATSYSVIAISNSIPSTKQTLVEVGKNNPNLPKLLELTYENRKFTQKYSQLNLTDRLYESGDLDSTQIVLYSHNVVQGLYDLSINKSPFTNSTKVDRGYLRNNFPSTFFLGNSVGTLPFLGELSQFLLFSPAISELDLLALANLLSSYVPFQELGLREFVFTSSDNLAITGDTIANPKVLYRLPIILNQISLSSNNPVVTNVVILAGLKWDNLSEVQWNLVSETLWNNMV